MAGPAATASADGAWVVRPSPRPEAGVRLFCFPYAGGGTAAFVPWTRLLPEDVELCPVRLPGRETRLREAPLRRMGPLVEALAGAVRPFLDRPFAFFGHSMGALVAHELACRVRDDGGPEPLHLFVSGRRAPQLSDRDPPIAGLPDAAFVDELLRRYDGIPRAVLASPELMELFLPVLRADCELLETYGFDGRRPLAAPISAFGGREDRRVLEGDLAAWRERTVGTFGLRLFPGGHFYFQGVEEPLVTVIAEALAEPRGGARP